VREEDSPRVDCVSRSVIRISTNVKMKGGGKVLALKERKRGRGPFQIRISGLRTKGTPSILPEEGKRSPKLENLPVVREGNSLRSQKTKRESFTCTTTSPGFGKKCSQGSSPKFSKKGDLTRQCYREKWKPLGTSKRRGAQLKPLAKRKNRKERAASTTLAGLGYVWKIKNGQSGNLNPIQEKTHGGCLS